MVGPKERVEADLLGGPGQREDLGAGGTMVRLEQDTDPHRGISSAFSSERTVVRAASISGKRQATSIRPDRR
jgi:hypothetical protein